MILCHLHRFSDSLTI